MTHYQSEKGDSTVLGDKYTNLQSAQTVSESRMCCHRPKGFVLLYGSSGLCFFTCSLTEFTDILNRLLGKAGTGPGTRMWLEARWMAAPSGGSSCQSCIPCPAPTFPPTYQPSLTPLTLAPCHCNPLSLASAVSLHGIPYLHSQSARRLSIPQVTSSSESALSMVEVISSHF